MKRKFHRCLLAVLFSAVVSSCSFTDPDFQKDADVVRLEHLEYYGSLLDEYFMKTNHYPFQGNAGVPLYVHVANDHQIKSTRNGPPYAHEVVSFKKLVLELEKVLGREINEYYDPQLGSDGMKPNFYVYMISGDNYYFAVHVYQPFDFSNKISEGYNKIEISNKPRSNPKIHLFKDLVKNKKFVKEKSKKIVKDGFFRDRENKYLHFTKN